MSGKKGRPLGWRKENPSQRERRQLRAFEDEWAVIKDFMQLVRELGVEKAAEIIKNAKGT